MRTIYSADGPEISDLLVSYDPDTLERIPVKKRDVIEELKKYNNDFAIKVVERLNCDGEYLNFETVDRLLIKAHCEMQRLSEEFYHGHRVKELLLPVIKSINETGYSSPIRVVDIGCGTGFVVRWLTKYGGLPSNVEVAGVDLNRALVEEAARLAGEEDIRCKFTHANAFRLDDPASIFITTGVIHHFNSNESLTRFFVNHQSIDSLQSFIHFDFQPNLIAPLGSWFFHIMRMREPLCWHDGVLSAARAHPYSMLLECARKGAPEFESAMYGRRFWRSPFPRVFQTLVGIKPHLKELFLKNLGVLSMQWEH